MNSQVDDILKRARKIARDKKAGWNKSRMAREAGIGVSTLIDLDKDDFNPTSDTLRKLETVIRRAEFDIAASEGEALRHAVS